MKLLLNFFKIKIKCQIFVFFLFFNKVVIYKNNIFFTKDNCRIIKKIQKIFKMNVTQRSVNQSNLEKIQDKSLYSLDTG